MADALLFADVRRSRFFARINWSIHPFADLVAPALVLGLWRVWTSTMAPRMDVYFSAEALLIVYAYFAVVRAVFLSTHSYDRSGRHSRALAQQAARDFWLGLWHFKSRIATAVLSLLVAALVLDLLTAHSGMTYRPNLHLTILAIEIMIWARYGAAVVLASALWDPPQALGFAHARSVANKAAAASSFALTNAAYGVVALAVVFGYKWGGALLPSARAEVVVSAILFSGLALLALWLQCRWARIILPQLKVQPAIDRQVPAALQRAA